jgi:uncharacterized protein (TIGR00255 family)
MVKSMTGCGRGERMIQPGRSKVIVEIRTVNHKFLEVALKLPQHLNGYESEIREIVRSHLRRGYVQLSLTADEGVTGPTLTLDRQLVKEYLGLASELRSKYKLTGTVDVNSVLEFPGIVKAGKTDKVLPLYWTGVRQVIEEAFADLKRMRAQEGAALTKDLKQSVTKIIRTVRMIEKRVPKRLAERRRNLLTQMKSLDVNVDPKRLLEEVTFISERLDIHEECVRLLSHCKLFTEALSEPGIAGKKLDFILQEMLRETDTLAAKARDAYISHRAITIKEEIEKLKEQVRNVE